MISILKMYWKMNFTIKIHKNVLENEFYYKNVLENEFYYKNVLGNDFYYKDA